MTAAATFLLLLLAGSLAFAGAAEEFSYEAQEEWTGVCNADNQMRQSPINIVASGVENNDNLVALQMTGWDTPRDVVLSNNGATALFTLTNAAAAAAVASYPRSFFYLREKKEPGSKATAAATFVNHLGTYQLLQFHMHWGERTGQGSEHRIGGEQAELEIHFVTRQADDDLSVLGILADVDNSNESSITGFWSMLDVAAISSFGTNATVENFRIDQLLPSNLDYWFYLGSLTIPPCTEIVNWFVLKNRITVPGAFLEQLRQLETDDEGTLLTFNFRMEQEIGERNVYQYPSSAAAGHSASFPVSISLVVALKLF